MDRDYWNGEAGEKWANAAELMDDILLPYAEALVNAANVREGSVVVDVGCGCGGTTLRIAEHTDAKTVIGVDVSKPMLAVARARAARSNAVIEFHQADASEATPHNGPVDRVVSRFGIMFFADPAAAFANLRSWLAPGGQLVATVWGPLQENPWLRDLLEIVGRHVEAPATDPNAPGPFSLGDRDGLERLLHRAGFHDLVQDNLEIPMRVPGSVADAVQFCLSRGPVAKTLAEHPETTKSEITADVRSYVESRYDGSGTPLQAQARLVVAS